MHLCKCSLIFFLHHIYTAQTVKLLNVLISTPMAMKLFETFRRCEKAGTPIKAAVTRCWQRGRGVWSAPIVFVLGWGPAGVPDSSALTHSAQPRPAALLGAPLHPRGRLQEPGTAQPELRDSAKSGPGRARACSCSEVVFASVCHLRKQRWGKFHSQRFQKFPSEVIKKKSGCLNETRDF